MTATKTKRYSVTPKQTQAVGLLVAGINILEVADQLDVAPSTIHRWRKCPAFRASLNQATGDVLSASLALATTARLKAIQTLVDAMTDSDFPPADRIRAAGIILTLPTCPEPDQRVCTVEGIEQLEKEATMDPVELLTSRFQL